jgi:enoyl-[acyl-carrier protein] reductase III
MDDLCTTLSNRNIRFATKQISLNTQASLDQVITWLDGLSIKPGVIAWLAASGVMRPVKELNMHHLGWTFQVSAFSLAIITARLAPRKLIVISSTGATRVVENYGALGAAKSALETMLRYLAVELAPNTSVFGIRAGLVETSAAHRLPDFDTLRTSVLSRTPMGRLVTPADIAKLVGLLASEDLEMLTGSILDLDGGLRLVL